MKHNLMLGAASAALLLLAASPSLAAETPASAVDSAADETTVEAIVVLGQGQSRSVQTLTSDALSLEAAGTSPLKAIEKLAGVNFQSADAFGAYEWSTRISIRGFNQNQLGFTLDGVPLGDMSYGNHNGLHISRAIASEDLGEVELAQGSGALDTASTSNLGGTLKFSSRDPSEQFGILAAVTGGSESTYRAHLRLDTGVLPSGGRAYVSYVNQNGDKWKGDGQQKQEQFGFKLVQPAGPATLTAFINGSKRRENDYQDLSLGMINRLGYGFDNISDNWPLAVRLADIGNNRGDTGTPPTNPAAGSVYPAPFTTIDDAYFDAAGLRDDTIGAITIDAPINEMITLSGTVYGHGNTGQGLWFTPYVPSPNAYTPGATTNNAPISIRTTEYDINRTGLITGATVTLGDHRIEGGWWYEDNDFHQARRFYALNRAAPQRDSLDFQSDPFFTQWAYRFETLTSQFHLSDTWSVTEALTVNAGFKSLRVKNAARTIVAPASGAIDGSIISRDKFLPQVGANWKLNDNNEVFGSYSENIRAFVSAATAGPFSTTQAGFNAIRSTLKPESSKTIELGWRVRGDGFEGVVTAYHVDFENRLLGTQVGAGIVGNPVVLANVGSVETQGVEAAGTWRFMADWSVFGSYAYNDSSYSDDVRNGSGVLVAATAGKETVDTPKHLLKTELAYDNGGLYAKVAANYTSERFFTYTNDQKVPSRTIVNLTAGYRFQGEGLLNGLEVQANVTNLLDEEYVSTIGSNGFGNSGDNQTLLAGAPRQGFVTIKKQF
ncbi:TonB-dependent receptor family protein [Caulobacter sp. DWR1-3-2b1]|uniref:TonB-dependent receptor family protein n=1 Tax=Caulobacter sp. DWR1-3-2b1 TaxID=2804670 RepID=UPI003CED25FD